MKEIDIDIPIKLNWQVNNDSFGGKFKGSAQCGPTSASQMLSAFIPEASTDEFVKKFIQRIDADWLSGKVKNRQSAFQFNYAPTIDFFLKEYKIARKAVVVPHSGTIDTIIEAIENGSPIMASTMLTGDGHYVTISGINTKTKMFKMKDPFGLFDFKTAKYIKVADGAGNAEYPIDSLSVYLEKSSVAASGGSKKGFRFIYLGKI
jgi:hypothetical protein